MKYYFLILFVIFGFNLYAQDSAVKSGGLDRFLQYPVKYFTITKHNGGFITTRSTVKYEAESDTVFKVGKYLIEPLYDTLKNNAFSNTVSSALLRDVLNQMNQAPGRIPRLKEFNITSNEWQHFREFTNHAIDTLSDNITDSIFGNKWKKKNRVDGSYFYQINIDLVNARGDSLSISHIDVLATAWCLPWLVKYHGRSFNCYSIAFSNFIKLCLPTDRYSDWSDNDVLLNDIANYLKLKQEK